MSETWNAANLAALHPLTFRNANKQAVYEKCCPPGTEFVGDIYIARWSELELPNTPFDWGREMQVTAVNDFFDYAQGDDEVTHWYPNFADPDLFGFWDSDLLAQDELQVLEHPILAAVRKNLMAESCTTATTHYDTVTPFVLRGVERHIALDVRGLYGNAFYRAPVQECLDAAVALNPPTISNIYALTAISCGTGHYTYGDICRLLRAAYTAFMAAKEATLTKECALHVGYWGCGAFGGNRVLMTALQLFAAHLAGVDKVVFHTGETLILSVMALRSMSNLMKPPSRMRMMPFSTCLAMTSSGERVMGTSPVQDFLDGLGGTADEIADRIREMNIVGVPRGGIRDHIINKALYFQGINSWGFQVTSRGNMIITDCQIIGNIKTPKPVADFNRLFDAGEYPDLFDWGSWEVQRNFKAGRYGLVDESVIKKLRVMRDP